jgi:hypothetical protein
VPGDELRRLIRAYLEQSNAATRTYKAALEEKRAGYDWEALIDTATSDRRAFEWILPVIADGPFIMSITQWVTLRNKFVEVRTAEQVLEAVKRREEARAAHSTPAGGGQ